MMGEDRKSGDTEPFYRKNGDFPGGPVVKTLCFQCKGSILGQGTNIPHAMPCGQENTKKKKKK